MTGMDENQKKRVVIFYFGVISCAQRWQFFSPTAPGGRASPS
ncbi:hypothetical protein DFAR_1900002 [Desulfarculales bacterium]